MLWLLNWWPAVVLAVMGGISWIFAGIGTAIFTVVMFGLLFACVLPDNPRYERTNPDDHVHDTDVSAS